MRDWAVNDAGILAMVVVPAPVGRRRRYALRRITTGSIRTYIRPGSAADPAVEVAAAERAVLERGQPPLKAGDLRIGCQAVLDEVQGAARPQDPADLGQSPAGIRDRSQGPGAQHAIDGTLRTPARCPRASEESLAGYLHQARELLAARPDRIDDGPTGLPGDFEALRWFPLPPACLAYTERLTDRVP